MENVMQLSQTTHLLKFAGKMTYEYYRELEEKVVDAIRRYQRLEIDLSEVIEIDLCGLHLVGLLQSAGVIIATSAVVEQASKGLLATLQSSALGRARRSDRVSMSQSVTQLPSK